MIKDLIWIQFALNQVAQSVGKKKKMMIIIIIMMMIVMMMMMMETYNLFLAIILSCIILSSFLLASPSYNHLSSQMIYLILFNLHINILLFSEEFILGAEAARLPCTHFFHRACIIPWYV